MLSSGLSKSKIVAAVFGFHAAAALLFYFLVLPLAVPAGAGIAPEALTSLRFNFTVAVCLTAAATAVVLAIILSYMCAKDDSIQLFLDALPQPAILVDADSRYALFNTEAERALGVSRTKDTGKPLAPEFLPALSARPALVDRSRTIIDKNGKKFLLTVRSPSGQSTDAPEKGRMLLFKDISRELHFLDSVTEIIREMGALYSDALDISNSSLSLSQGATQQANSLAAISSSLDEFSKKIHGNTESAVKGSQLASQAREAAERSGTEIANALAAMNDVQDAGVRIARIVKLIDDIAFQTNLLALNAAVEAARAGRQGKGFAVVADEVRNLAGRSAKAAKDTAGMVEDVTERIGNASAYISKLEEILRNIVQDAIRMADSSASASATSSEQAATILQVNQELGQISNVTNYTMSSAEKTAAAVERVSKQVAVLKERFDHIGREFLEEQNLTIGIGKTAAPTTINLLAEPKTSPCLSPSFHSPTRVDGTMDDPFALPFKTLHDEKWGGASGPQRHETSSTSFTAPDADYDDFFSSSATRDIQPHLTGPAEYKTTPDGDRIVQPSRHIRLDDSEFGRY